MIKLCILNILEQDLLDTLSGVFSQRKNESGQSDRECRAFSDCD